MGIFGAHNGASVAQPGKMSPERATDLPRFSGGIGGR